MTVYGYMRISTAKQKIDRQITDIKKEYPEAILIEETYTGKTLVRPEFQKLLKKLKKGDRLVCESVSRFSRNAEEGYNLYKELYEKGISITFIKEHHIDTDTYTKEMNRQIDLVINSGDKAADKLIQAIMGALNDYMMSLVERQIYLAFQQSQKEVDDLRQRTKEGIAVARAEGKQVGNRKGSTRLCKKSVEAKETIRKYNRSFGGQLKDRETIKLSGIAPATYYKLKRQIVEEMASE